MPGTRRSGYETCLLPASDTEVFAKKREVAASSLPPCLLSEGDGAGLASGTECWPLLCWSYRNTKAWIQDLHKVAWLFLEEPSFYSWGTPHLLGLLSLGAPRCL